MVMILQEQVALPSHKILDKHFLALTLILLMPSILAPPRNASTPNADKTRH
jgi:hypothetical protein